MARVALRSRSRCRSSERVLIEPCYATLQRYTRNFRSKRYAMLQRCYALRSSGPIKAGSSVAFAFMARIFLALRCFEPRAARLGVMFGVRSYGTARSGIRIVCCFKYLASRWQRLPEPVPHR
jgi:hypothetical protein